MLGLIVWLALARGVVCEEADEGSRVWWVRGSQISVGIDSTTGEWVRTDSKDVVTATQSLGVGAVTSRSRATRSEDGSVVVAKTVAVGEEVAETEETWSADGEGVLWTYRVRSVSRGPWAAVVTTTARAGEGDGYWVARGGLESSRSDATWDDVLARDVRPRKLQYGQGFFNGTDGADFNETVVLPCAAHFSGPDGVALAHAVDDTTFAAKLAVDASRSTYERYYNRLDSSRGDVVFRTRIVRAASPRDVLRSYRQTFPAIFRPHEAAEALATRLGLGMYTCADVGDLALADLQKSGGNLVWDASFFWPYTGMFLPDAPHLEALTWASNLGSGEQADCGPTFAHGQNVSLDRIRARYRRAAERNATVRVPPS